MHIKKEISCSFILNVYQQKYIYLHFHFNCISDTSYIWDQKSNKWEVEKKETISLVEEKDIDNDNDDEEFDDDDDTIRVKHTIMRQDMTKGKYGHDGITQTYTDPADGTVYIWDREKNAWFPKVNNYKYKYLIK